MGTGSHHWSLQIALIVAGPKSLHSGSVKVEASEAVSNMAAGKSNH